MGASERGRALEPPTPTPDVVKQLIAFIEPHDPEFALYVRLSGVLGENGAACRLPPRRDSSNSGALAFRCDGRVGRGQQMSSTQGGQSRRCSASAEEYAGVGDQCRRSSDMRKAALRSPLREA